MKVGNYYFSQLSKYFFLSLLCRLFFGGEFMKLLNEFKPLWNFIKEDKIKVIIAGIIIFITEIINTLGGYLNGQIVESITKLDLKKALLFLLIYLSNNIIVDAWLYMLISNISIYPSQ